MRPSKSRSRNKNNRQRTLGNVVNRVFDSSGPEGKVRGTPQQIIEKYLTLARDAQLSNDRVAEQSFLQHAEHYTRMLGEAQREMADRQGQAGYPNGTGHGGPGRDEDSEGDMRDDRRPESQPREAPRDGRRDDRLRDDRPRDDRPRDDRPRDDRPRDDRPRDDRPRDDRFQADRSDRRDDRPRDDRGDRPRDDRPRDDRPRDDRSERRDDRSRGDRRDDRRSGGEGMLTDAGGLPPALGIGDDRDVGPVETPEDRAAPSLPPATEISATDTGAIAEDDAPAAAPRRARAPRAVAARPRRRAVGDAPAPPAPAADEA